MVVVLDTTIQEIADFGESFKWPDYDCEKCSRKMWGHGFVERYFEGISMALRIKRLFCPCCGMVVVFRPRAFFPRFQSSVTDMFKALSERLMSGFWPVGFIRQRGWYWLKQLMSAVLMAGSTDPVDFLQDRLRKGVHFFTS